VSGTASDYWIGNPKFLWDLGSAANTRIWQSKVAPIGGI